MPRNRRLVKGSRVESSTLATVKLRELNVRKQKYCGFSISFICREGERLCAAMKTKKKMQLQRLDRGWMNEGKGERRLKVGKSKVYERIGNVGVLV